MVSESTAANAAEWRCAGQVSPLTSSRVCSLHVRVAESRNQKSPFAALSATSTQATLDVSVTVAQAVWALHYRRLSAQGQTQPPLLAL